MMAKVARFHKSQNIDPESVTSGYLLLETINDTQEDEGIRR
jgi:hypothetical protein